MNGVFGNYLHPFEQNSFSDSILDGSLELNNFDVSAAVKNCIREMTYAPGEDGVTTVNPTITADDVREGVKAIAEKLTSSPSGRHYGHYKAAIGDPDLCEVYATLMPIPFEMGFHLCSM